MDNIYVICSELHKIFTILVVDNILNEFYGCIRSVYYTNIHICDFLIGWNFHTKFQDSSYGCQ